MLFFLCAQTDLTTKKMTLSLSLSLSRKGNFLIRSPVSAHPLSSKIFFCLKGPPYPYVLPSYSPHLLIYHISLLIPDMTRFSLHLFLLKKIHLYSALKNSKNRAITLQTEVDRSIIMSFKIFWKSNPSFIFTLIFLFKNKYKYLK